jgi:hypothetical protein
MNHAHDYRVIDRRVRAPVGPPPGHTVFVLLGCDCGARTVFPRVNYELVDPAWRAAFERAHPITLDDSPNDGR